MKISRRAVVLGLALVTIGCDQATKRLAGAALESAPRRSYLADTVRLEYTENRGGFLGFGAELPWLARLLLFQAAPALIVAGTLLAALRARLSVAEAAALTLACGGGVSNLLDRVVHGRVIDFLNLGVGGVRTGIFNVADVAILIGALLVLLRRRAGVTSGARKG